MHKLAFDVRNYYEKTAMDMNAPKSHSMERFRLKSGRMTMGLSKGFKKISASKLRFSRVLHVTKGTRFKIGNLKKKKKFKTM